jgi:hypothetical protein
LALAGLFDLNIRTNIPIYKKFGHMGEAAFVVWLCTTVYNAAQTGRIGPTDSALTVMSKVIQPAIDSWGYGPMSDPHADLIQRLIVTMILQYCAGAQTNWYAIGGDYPTQFRTLPAFAFPYAQPVGQPAIQPVTASPTPSPVAVTPAPSSYAQPGSYLVQDTPGTMVTPQGTWQLSGAGAITLNGNLAAQTPQATGGVGTLGILYQNGQTYAYNSDGQSYVFIGNQGGWNATTSVPTPPTVFRFRTAAQIAAAQAAAQAQTVAAAAQAAAALTAANQAAAAQAAAATTAAAAQAAATQAAATTSTTTSATNTVSTTPPAIGGAIKYLKDNSTGNMMLLPTARM